MQTLYVKIQKSFRFLRISSFIYKNVTIKKTNIRFLEKNGIPRQPRNVVISFFSRDQQFLVLWSGGIVRGFQFPFFGTLWRSIPRVPGVPCALLSYISNSHTRGLIFLEMNSPIEQFSKLHHTQYI